MPTKRGGKLPSEVTLADIKRFSSPAVVKSFTGGVSRGRTRGLSQRQIQEARASEQERKLAQAIKEKAIADKALLEQQTAGSLLESIRRQEALQARLREARRARNFSAEASAAVELREELGRQAAITGQAFTSSQVKKLLGGERGMQALKAGSRAEKQFFKKTGVSLQQKRLDALANLKIAKTLVIRKVGIETRSSPLTGKIEVRLPNGKYETINSTGKVIISASLAGRKLEFFNGKLIMQIDLANPVDYIKLTKQELRDLKDELPTNIDLIVDSNGNLIALKDTREKKYYNVASIDKYVNIRERSDLGKRSKVFQESLKLSKKWTSDIQATKTRLKASNKANELNRLNELNAKIRQNQASASERQERQALLKKTAKNYELAGELVGKTIGLTLINMGVGSAELLKALKEDPVVTLAALPSNIYKGLKADYNRVMSGDILEIGQVGLEYYTIGKVFGLMGKGAKAAYKTSMGIGRQLSPKYLGPIANKLKIPPLRGALSKVTPKHIKLITKRAVKNALGTKKYNTFIRKANAGRVLTNKRIDRILAQSRKVSAKNKIIASEAKRPIALASKKAIIKKINTKIQREYTKSLKHARQVRARTRQRYTTIRPKTPDYDKALNIVEGFSDVLATLKARNFVVEYLKKGGKLTSKQADDFVKAVQINLKNKLSKLPDYQKLQRYDKLARSSAIKLIKQNRIVSARNMARSIIKKIEATKLVRGLNDVMIKVKKGIVVKKARAGAVKVKGAIKKTTRKIEIKKINKKTAKQYKAELRRAKIRRAKMRKKYDVMTVGDHRYTDAVAFIDDYAKLIAAQRAKRIVDSFAKRGVKLTTSQKSKVVLLSRKQADNFLKNSRLYGQLQGAAKMFTPQTIKLVKIGKLKLARAYVKALKKSMRNIKGMDKLRNLVRKVKGKVSPKRIKRAVARKKVAGIAREKFQQTNRYRMEKARPIRSVTIDQLRNAKNVNSMNKVVDRFFVEIAKRRKVDVTSLQFRQMKNVLKKRLAKAIRTGDKKQIRSFTNTAKKMLDDLNSPTKQPSITVIKTTAKTQPARTIKNFKPTTTRGTYVEIKSGQQILLQKVKTVQKQATKVVQEQALIVRTVTKPKLSMMPLVKVLGLVLAAQILKVLPKTKKKYNSQQLYKWLSVQQKDIMSDVKVLQSLDSGAKSSIAQNVIQKQPEITKTVSRTRTDTLSKKKKKAFVPKRENFISKKKSLTKKTVAYHIEIKRGGKFVRTRILPLPRLAALDLLAYRLDKELGRTGRLVSAGAVNKVGILPARIKGYYQKHKNKFRRYRIQKGIRIPVVLQLIEKGKYVGDTKSEQVRLRAARKKVVRRKRTVKKKVVHRKKKVVRKKTVKKRKVVKRKNGKTKTKNKK